MSSPSNPPLHVILGAGQVGPLVARRLLARGLAVRMVRRGRFGAELPSGAVGVQADVLDPAALAGTDRVVTSFCATRSPRTGRRVRSARSASPRVRSA